jgi:DNA adenine methylase
MDAVTRSPKTRRIEAPALRPFLKWAGNKYRLVERIKRKLPEGERLIEPFVGSGAVFLNTDFPNYLLSDSNGDLINLYQTLQKEGEAFIEYCRKIFVPRNNQAERYYELRQEFNTSRGVRRRAALFLYLNRHGYNGLCRYNAGGGFNVPFGRYKRPYFPAKEMRAFHAWAQRATFMHEDFETVMRGARPGDVVYCDPPYFPLSTSANFTSYSAGGFSLEHQHQLAELAAETARRGVPVLISNHSTKETRSVYAGADVSGFQVQRYISCNGANRNKVQELLALFA